MASSPLNEFDPQEKESQLQRESQSWEIGDIQSAAAGDIPVIDVSEYFASQGDEALEKVAIQLCDACTRVGFWSMTGHQFPEAILQAAFTQAHRFLDLPLAIKNTLVMDQPGWPVGGVGYMPVKNRKLPARKKSQPERIAGFQTRSYCQPR